MSASCSPRSGSAPAESPENRRWDSACESGRAGRSCFKGNDRSARTSEDRPIGIHQPILEVDHALAMRGNVVFMRDDDDCLTFAMELPEQRHDVAAGG